MKKTVCFILLGILGILFAGVASANSDVGIHKVYTVDDSATPTIGESTDLVSPLTESFIVHVALAPERQILRPLDLGYVDRYLLKIPKHYLLPEKNVILFSEDCNVRC
jgi:hypothetical protein